MSRTTRHDRECSDVGRIRSIPRCSSRFNITISDYEWMERGSREFFLPETWMEKGHNVAQIIDELKERARA